MKLFENNWLASKWVDFEYKKYTLLSYLQQVEAKYKEQKVYPYLLMLRHQADDLLMLKNTLQSFQPTELQQMLFGDEPDLNFQSEEIENLLKVAEFSLPRIEESLEEGASIEDFVMKSINFQAVGVLPTDKREGYLIFRTGESSRIYQYQLRRITPGSDNEIHSTRLKTWLLESSSTEQFTTLTDIKYRLIKTQKELPNPATYAIECDMDFPYPETLVPVGRKLLYNSILVD